jgi:hypothetical protein
MSLHHTSEKLIEIISDWFVSFCRKVEVLPENFTNKLRGKAKLMHREPVIFFSKKINTKDVIREAIREKVIFEWRDLGIISPWRVRSTVSHFMTELYNIAKNNPSIPGPPVNFNSDKLPLEVVLNNKTYQHVVTEEFCFGLLLFAKLSGVDYTLSMFGSQLDFNVLNKQYTTYNWDDLRQYKFVINESEVYYFDNEDFIRGFVTGSNQTNLDHCLYWKHICNLNEHEEYEEMDFDKILCHVACEIKNVLN